MAANNHPHTTDVRTTAELESSLEDFRKKVDANYRAFFDETPSFAEEKRSLFHLWLQRCTGIRSK